MRLAFWVVVLRRLKLSPNSVWRGRFYYCPFGLGTRCRNFLHVGELLGLMSGCTSTGKKLLLLEEGGN